MDHWRGFGHLRIRSGTTHAVLGQDLDTRGEDGTSNPGARNLPSDTPTPAANGWKPAFPESRASLRSTRAVAPSQGVLARPAMLRPDRRGATVP